MPLPAGIISTKEFTFKLFELALLGPPHEKVLPITYVMVDSNRVLITVGWQAGSPDEIVRPRYPDHPGGSHAGNTATASVPPDR